MSTTEPAHTTLITIAVESDVNPGFQGMISLATLANSTTTRITGIGGVVMEGGGGGGGWGGGGVGGGGGKGERGGGLPKGGGGGEAKGRRGGGGGWGEGEKRGKKRRIKGKRSATKRGSAKFDPPHTHNTN